jgi:hypothetical protein
MKNKQMKLYTENEIVGFLTIHYKDEICAKTFMKNLTPVQLPIDEEIKIKINESNTFSMSGTTSTTKLCALFVPHGDSVNRNICKNCGKEANQHPIITPTI